MGLAASRARNVSLWHLSDMSQEAMNVRFEMQRGPDRQDEGGDHRLNNLETIQSFNHAR
jgi:hypothetical protein